MNKNEMLLAALMGTPIEKSYVGKAGVSGLLPEGVGYIGTIKNADFKFAKEKSEYGTRTRQIAFELHTTLDGVPFIAYSFNSTTSWMPFEVNLLAPFIELAESKQVSLLYKEKLNLDTSSPAFKKLPLTEKAKMLFVASKEGYAVSRLTSSLIENSNSEKAIKQTASLQNLAVITHHVENDEPFSLEGLVGYLQRNDVEICFDVVHETYEGSTNARPIKFRTASSAV
jgi:hypothetical protein